MSIGLLWSIAMGVLSLGAALILVLSKSFVREFEAEREKAPHIQEVPSAGTRDLDRSLGVTATSIDIANFGELDRLSPAGLRLMQSGYLDKAS
jgi:hypothetical protein